jgi:hypothetical protein
MKKINRNDRLISYAQLHSEMNIKLLKLSVDHNYSSAIATNLSQSTDIVDERTRS